MSVALHPDIDKVLISDDEIRDIVARLGAEISRDYEGKNPLVVSVLRGAFIFTADLLRAISVPCEVDFMAVSSYGAGTKSSGVVKILKDLDTHVEGRHLIFAEDILDSGLTLQHLIELFKTRGAASIEVCAFAVKDIPGYVAPITPKYVGTHVPNEFIVGYGLDYAEAYRGIPYVGVLKPSVYNQK